MAHYWNEEYECMPREKLCVLQEKRLRETVSRVYENVPFYRNAFDKIGLKPDDIKSLDDLKKLPFTNKDDLRDNYPYGLFAVPLSEVIRLHASSGTTGKPTVVGYTRQDIRSWAEVMARSLSCCGANKNSKIPPGFTTLILLADRSQGLLPTVLSRCQMFRMQRLTKNEVCSVIVKHLALPGDKALLFASLSDGIPGKGLQLAGSKEFNDVRDEVLEFLAGIPEMNDMEKMGYRDLFIKHKDKIDVVVDIMMLWFRDVLACKEAGNSSLIVNLDKLPLLKGQASLYTIKRISNAIEKIEQSRRMLKGNTNYQLTIENLLLSL